MAEVKKTRTLLNTEKDWNEIEDLVNIYKKQFEDLSYKAESDKAMLTLLEKFKPMFLKYIKLFKTGIIDFKDADIKFFVLGFTKELELKKALKSKRQRTDQKKRIISNFNFIKDTYGELPEEEIMSDLQMLFISLAKKYKYVGKSFCGYVFNCFKFNVLRYVRKYLNDVSNIKYRMIPSENILEYVEASRSHNDISFYEEQTDTLGMNWVTGKECSSEFSNLTNLERKIILMYYLERYPTDMICEQTGLTKQEVTDIRRQAAYKIADNLGLSRSDIKRTRNTIKNIIKMLELEKTLKRRKNKDEPKHKRTKINRWKMLS